MKIALIGGHLSPALAVIEELPQVTEVIFIGRKETFEGDDSLSLEYKTISDRGIKFYPLRTGRLQRKITTSTATTLLKVPSGFFKARGILKKEKPDVVLGFGGYLSLPVCLAAKSLGIPIVIHEQTLEAGLANKIISKFADKVCVSWVSSKDFFPKQKTVLTGNPIRKEIQTVQTTIRTDLQILPNTPTIYITGGSTGSHAINDAVLSCIEVLLEEAAVIHQTGDAQKYNDFDALEKKKNALSMDKKTRYRLVKFVDPSEVGYIMKNATLIVSRAGINTISELLFLKKPALLIPIPFAQRQEQLKNAQMLKNKGLAEVLEQNELTGKSLLEKITSMLENLKKYTINEDSGGSNGVNAAQAIFEVVKDVANEKKNNQEKK